MESLFGYILISIVMCIVQIYLWNFLPKIILNFLFAVPVFALGINFAGSFLILRFTGVTQFIGISNLTSSVLFGIYIYYYRQINNIKGVRISSIKIFKIPILPYIKFTQFR
jgi:hypothetical protein